MLESLLIENFRTFKSLRVEGFGRFNLVVGANDSGKTSLLAAAAFSESATALKWAARLAYPGVRLDDLDRVWRPLFHGAVTDTPVTFTVGPDLRRVTIQLQSDKRRPGHPQTEVSWSSSDDWAIAVSVDLGGVTLRFPAQSQVDDAWWSGTTMDTEADLVGPVKDLYAGGRIAELATAVRRLHPGVQRVDLVGDSLWLVLDGHPLPLPITVLGDGSRRMLEFAIPVAQRLRALYIDEIDNGFHWSTLGKVWSFLRESEIGQVFATTHREECIRIACETFQEAGDDSLRIIRLDRTADGHRAVVYTAATALAAMDAGLEIRG